MRKLASIQVVNAAEPSPNADAIERIRVLGWWVVVKKGEFKLGDKVVYCEIDSLLPERAEFEFLRPSSYKPEVRDDVSGVIQSAGFRIHLEFQSELRGGAGRNFNTLDLADFETGNTHPRAARQSADVRKFRVEVHAFAENIVAVSDQKEDCREETKSQDQEYSNSPGMNAHVIPPRKPIL